MRKYGKERLLDAFQPVPNGTELVLGDRFPILLTPMTLSNATIIPIKCPPLSATRELAEVVAPVALGLERVRELITERVFRDEEFADLLLATGEKAGWDRMVLPEWLQRIAVVPVNGYQSKTRAMSEHLMGRGGKLFRASLILSILRSLSPKEDRGPKLAAAMELIHLATLLHDDVIDRADFRRGSPSLPALHDNSPTVLMGDHLFARAFELIAECEHMGLISSSCRATSAMCRGEIEQLQWIGRADVPEQAYFRLIEMKTAALMASCAEGAAILSGLANRRGEWYRFGLSLGLLFQMTDDLLDFVADQRVLGKQTGSDAAAGKYTLPLILLRERLGGPEALETYLTERSGSGELSRSLESEGVLEEVRVRLHQLADSCREQLRSLSADAADPPAFDALYELVDFVLYRDH